MSPFEGAPEEFDQTIFSVHNDRSIGPIERLAQNYVKEQHRYVLVIVYTLSRLTWKKLMIPKD